MMVVPPVEVGVVVGDFTKVVVVAPAVAVSPTGNFREVAVTVATVGVEVLSVVATLVTTCWESSVLC